MKILFLCVANSARSQMAEALARSLWGDHVDVQSAGSSPSGQIHPGAISVLKKAGHDLTNQFSKSINSLDADFLQDLNYVITLCAEEVCPALLTPAQKIHWPIDDPASSQPNQQAEAFQRTYFLIQKKIIDFSREKNIFLKIGV